MDPVRSMDRLQAVANCWNKLRYGGYTNNTFTHMNYSKRFSVNKTTHAILCMTTISFCLATLYLRVNWILPSLASPADEVTLVFLRIKPGELFLTDENGGIADTGTEADSRCINPSTASLEAIAASNAAEVAILAALWIESFEGWRLSGLSGTNRSINWH